MDVRIHRPDVASSVDVPGIFVDEEKAVGYGWLPISVSHVSIATAMNAIVSSGVEMMNDKSADAIGFWRNERCRPHEPSVALPRPDGPCCAHGLAH